MQYAFSVVATFCRNFVVQKNHFPPEVVIKKLFFANNVSICDNYKRACLDLVGLT